MDLRDLVEFIKDASKYIIVIVIVILICVFVLGLQQVIGPSMEPNIKEGDVLIVNKLIYRVSDIKRKDVVVISHDEKYMVKRIIGIPGDKVEFKENKLYINGNYYEEEYINSNEVYTEDFSLSDIGYEVIPDNMYLVLGDNRGDSLDSRSFGLVSEKNIIGKTWFRIWPFGKFGL